MTLTEEEQNTVKDKVLEKFGQDLVSKIDMKYMALADLRAASDSSYEFLEKVKETFPDQSPEVLLAGILFGMKMGELGVLYAQEHGMLETPKPEAKEEKKEEKKEEEQHVVIGYKGDYSEQMYG